MMCKPRRPQARLPVLLLNMLFSLVMGVIESLFAKELLAYLNAYHQKKLAEGIANAPITKAELLESFSG